MSDIQKVNSVGDNFEPCGTPVWIIPAFDLTPLQLVADCLPLMYFDSHRQVASGSADLAIFDSRTLWLTVSNAAIRSTTTQIVRCGSFLCLKPVATSLVSCSRAEVVECQGRNTCWSVAGSRCVLTVVSMRASITFAAWQSSEIVRYEVPVEESLPGLGIGMTIYDLQIRHDVTESLKSAMRYSIALGPRFYRRIPVITCSVVNVTADINDIRLFSLYISRVSRVEVCLPCFDVVNCLLK